jgi:hypothetical protein
MQAKGISENCHVLEFLKCFEVCAGNKKFDAKIVFFVKIR